MPRPAKVGITDHALVRWLERVHGIDVEAYRSLLMHEVRPYLEAGCSGFPINGGRGVAHNGVLISVMEPGQGASHASGIQRRAEERALIDKFRKEWRQA